MSRAVAAALVLALVIPAGAQAPAAAREGVTVTFLASEGVMLSGATPAGPRTVLVDALFRKYETGYAVPPESTQRALAQAAPPFDGVDVVLATHRHGDHFHPAPVAAHLRANPRATLVASRQVVDSLRRHAPARELPASRTLARTMRPGTWRRQVINGVTVTVLGIPHVGRWRHRRVEHLGFLVELGGRRVLHLGDADIADEAFAPLRLDTLRIDVALVPLWAVTDARAREVVARRIRPRQVVAIHLPADDAARYALDVEAALPGAIAFARPLETRRW